MREFVDKVIQKPKRGRPRKYPFDRCPVNQSFFIIGGTTKNKRPLLHYHNRPDGFVEAPHTRKFIMAMYDKKDQRYCNDGEQGCWVTRLA